MDRDAAIRGIMRLIEEFRAKPYPELLALTDEEAIESQITAHGDLITLLVGVFRCGKDSVRIDVSAFGNNWWKCERLDESVVVTRDDHETV